ncbi:MAG: PilZ domain-containing protein [Gammaproteobacteria bacterium]|nr:PilZ domain-containing protein [Gammaproteobacteria bacterium]MCW8910862.1 PilZ domain-containing protein [Gammaproteobacteria bacterium]MCW9004006.1 PilZ domain-containing protein [Gammaproteobacteria bacterium]MCW9056092.1 PilZ domain-containing protein [Gammaproteobacteria bacterium]
MTKTNNNQNERRGFFRIEDEVHLEYEAVNEDEYNNAEQILNEVHKSTFALSANFATINHDNNYLLNNIRRNSPEISQYLDLLNQKIDALSQHLLENSTASSEDNLITVNISASGIAFNTSDKLEKNQAIKLRIVLLPEKVGIQAYGRIIDCKPDAENKGFLTSVDFEHIRNDDTELMIKHNINKQMIELRKRSEDEGS